MLFWKDGAVKFAISIAITSSLFGAGSFSSGAQDHDQLKSLSWSPKGDRILYGGYDGNLRIKNVRTGELMTVRRTGTPFILEVQWSPDGQRLLAITDKTIELLDVNGKEILLIVANPPLRPAPHPQFGPNNITAVFSPDGTRLALAGWIDGRVQILDAHTGRTEHLFTTINRMVSSISWSPNGRRIAAGVWDKTIRILDVDSHEEKTKIEVAVSGWVKVKFSPDGKRLAWHGFRSSSWLREIESGDERRIDIKDGTHSIDWSPGGRELAVLGWRTLDIWDAETGEKNVSFSVKEWMDEVFWSPDGRYLAALSNFSGRASIWNVRTRKNRTMNNANPLVFSPTMEWISIRDEVRVFSGF